MATIRPDALPAAASVNPAAALVVDDGVTVEKATPLQVVDSGVPLASQAEAEAGASNTTRMSPLRVAQAIDVLGVSLALLNSTDADEGASMVGTEGGGSVQDLFDGIDFLATAAGDGIEDDSAILYAATKLIALLPGKTYFLGATGAFQASILPLGGKLKRDPDVTVSNINIIGDWDDQIFDVSNMTAVEGVVTGFVVGATINGDGAHEWNPGTGAFKIPGVARLRWFMDSTEGDQSGAFSHLAHTDAGEQWISTACSYTNGMLGANPIIDAKLTMVTATKTYSGLAADPELTAFGEDRAFGLRPMSGLDRFHLRFTARGEIDGNAAASFDVADDFVTMQTEAGTGPGGSYQTTCNVNGLAINEFVGATWVAPGSSLIEDPYIHNCIRNCISANFAPNVKVVRAKLGDSFIDHLWYLDNEVFEIDGLEIFGHARLGVIHMSAGTIRGLRIGSDGLALNPITGENTETIVTVRSDIAGLSKIELALEGDFALLSSTAADRAIIQTSGGDNIEVTGWVKDTGADDAAVWTFFQPGSAGSSGLNFHDLQFIDMPLSLFALGTGTGGVTFSTFADIQWQVRAGTTTTAGFLLDFLGTFQNSSITNFRTTGSDVGYKQFIRVAGNGASVIIEGGYLPTLGGSAVAFCDFQGTNTAIYVVRTAARVASPAAVSTQAQFSDFRYGNSLTNFYNPTTTASAIANLTVTASSGVLPTPGGSVTIADAATPTTVELLDFCCELEAKLEALLAVERTNGTIGT